MEASFSSQSDHSRTSRGATIDGAKVRALRIQRTLTQQELADEVSVSKRTIEDIETSPQRAVSFATLKALSEFFKVQVDDLRLFNGKANGSEQGSLAGSAQPEKDTKAPVGMSLRLDCDFDSFNEADAFDFVQALKKLINLGAITIVGIEEGSVILHLQMSQSDAECLVAAAADKILNFLPIIDINFQGKRTQVQKHNKSLVHAVSVTDGMTGDDVKSVFNALLAYGQSEEGDTGSGFQPTDAEVGSAEKIEILRQRVMQGLPLWHRDDKVDYKGLTGVIRPRE